MLHTPLGSPLYSYFSTVVMDYLGPGLNYIQYNPGVPLMLTRAQPPVFHIISCIFLCNLLRSNLS